MMAAFSGTVEKDRLTISEIREWTFLPLITIYKSPSDFPGKYVARLWDLNRPTPVAVIADTYDKLTERLPLEVMTKMPRRPEDDPVIMEVWM